MKKLSLTVIALSLTAFIAFLSPSFAQTTVVVPNDLENTGTPSGISSPFSCATGGFATSERYQQVYLGSQFPEAGLIDKISFRLLSESLGSSPGFGPTDLSGVLIELSTTQAQPNALSNTFADNVGPDVQVVFSGVLTLSAPQCNENLPQPCPFDIMIPLQNPFFYNPENGNLLLDVRIPDCGDTQVFNSASNSSIVSIAFSTNVNSDVATLITDSGLVTQFRIIQPPPQFITLAPSSATNDAGTEHTVTATVLTNGTQDPGELVTFEVISGPNAGKMSDPNSGECTPNDDCTTDANGQVSWTYRGDGGFGTDTIIASFVDITGLTIESDPAEKLWVPPPRPIPTLSEWGLFITAGVLGMIGFMVIRRRKLRA